MAHELNHRAADALRRAMYSFSLPVLQAHTLGRLVCAVGLLCASVATSGHSAEPEHATANAHDAAPVANATPYDADAALQTSQAAVGRELGNYSFLDENGQAVKLSDYRGAPVLISMIYTSCFHTCPVTTQSLKQAVDAARSALDGRPFQVLTIGFDVPNDNPQSMAGFRATQAVRDERWAFLSSNKDTIGALTRDLGFAYYPSPRGFDHLVQLSVIDDKGVLYQQVYGESFELPWLVEPLKNLVFKDRGGVDHLLSNISNRVRLFCTLYDPASGRYRYDISLFIQMTIGAISILGGIVFLVREARRSNALKTGKPA